MPYDPTQKKTPCPVCGADANVRGPVDMAQEFWQVVECARCGDFRYSCKLGSAGLPIDGDIEAALASHIIRRMQGTERWMPLSEAFFQSLKTRALPTPAEMMENFLLWAAKETRGAPGHATLFYSKKSLLLGAADGPKEVNPAIVSIVGAVNEDDIVWVANNLVDLGYIKCTESPPGSYYGLLTGAGWQRVDELRKSSRAFSHAFFAGKKDNADLMVLAEKCLAAAVLDTGFRLLSPLRDASEINGIIEDEIRRSRFVVADISDGDGGAYWAAGLAEGLGKPVIYLCHTTKKNTAFAVGLRRVVTWNLKTFEQTAAAVKAAIRNAVPEARQSDD
jgi:hypothetical protein